MHIVDLMWSKSFKDLTKEIVLYAPKNVLRDFHHIPTVLFVQSESFLSKNIFHIVILRI